MSRPNEGARPWHFSVQDMIDSSEKALSYAEGLGKDEFLASQPNYDATLWNITLIGEAASNIPATVTGAHPEIPWRKITGTRHRLVHDYFRIDRDLVWDIVETDLPDLLPQLHALLNSAGEPA